MAVRPVTRDTPPKTRPASDKPAEFRLSLDQPANCGSGQLAGRATTLLNDDGTANNCLEQAAKQAKAGQDVVFLNDAAPKAGGVGHAVVQDRKTGQVTDPEAIGGKKTFADMGAFLDAAKAKGHEFTVAGHAAGEEVRAVLARPQGERAAFIARTDPSLVAVAGQQFAENALVAGNYQGVHDDPVGPTPTPGPNDYPGAPALPGTPAGTQPSEVPLVVNDVDPADGTILKGLMNVQKDWDDLGLGKTFKPTDVPKDDHAKTELTFIENNPTLSKVLGGEDGNISKKDVEVLIKKDQANAKDLQEVGTNDPFKDLTGIDDQQAKDIRKPLQEAKLLASHWDDWGFAGGQPWDPKTMPNNLSNEEQSALKDVETGALGKALTADHTTGKPDDDGTITRKDVLHSIDKLDSSAKSATSSFEAFIKDNKAPDPIAKQTAFDALVLQAHAPILDGAGRDAKLDNKFNLDDLKAIVTDPDNKGLPDALKGAAGLYADTGHFDGLSNAGLDPSKTSDGSVSDVNLTAFLSKGTSKSEDDTDFGLQSAATQQAVTDAGGDATKVGADYFTGGQTQASGADKTAALFQLSDTIGRYKDGEATFFPTSSQNPKTYTGEGLSPGQQRDDFVKDVQNRIDKLSGDPDVQKFTVEKVPDALHGIVNSDPKLKTFLQERLDDSSGSKALGEAFDAKGSDDKPLSTTEALAAFTSKPSFYAGALDVKPDLSKALGGTTKEIQDKVKAGYDDITSGRDYANLLGQGVPDDKAIIQTATNKAVYESVLDPQDVDEGSDKFDDSVNKVARDKLTDGLSMGDIYGGLGVSGADDPSLQQFVNNNLISITGPSTGGITASQVLQGVRSMDDMIRGGSKFEDAYIKLQKSLNNGTPKSGLPANLTDAYKRGYMHGVSSLILLGALGARTATGDQGSRLATATQSIVAAGLLTEGGAKYFKEKLAEINKTPGAVPKDDFKAWTSAANDVENVGKSVGGVVGNVLGVVVGGLFAKKSAQGGDIGGAAAQGVFAGLNGISAIAGAGEVAAYVVPRVFSSVAAASTASLGALAGTVSGVVGGVAAVGGLIYAIVKDIQATEKQDRQRDEWYDTITDDFKPFGVTVPDLSILARDPNDDPNAPAPPDFIGY